MIPYGSLAVLETPQGKKYIKRIAENEEWQSKDGSLSFACIHESDFGDYARTSLGTPIRIQVPTLEDLLQGIKRQTQIIYPKDIAYICLKLGAGPFRKIAEAGCGSGGLTLALSWFCGSTGQVVSHDDREEFVKLARRNLDWAGLGSNVTLLHRNIADGFDCENADALFLDVREPWLYLGQAVKAVKSGATLGFLLPTTNQIENLLLGLEKGPFADVEICEILIRRWKPLPDRLRPQDRMSAHTSFLVFCRRQERNEEFETWGPLGTRERKQEKARRERINES